MSIFQEIDKAACALVEAGVEPKFAVLTPDQIKVATAGLPEQVAYWKNRWAVETERSYRSGYTQGYVAAYHDAFALSTKKGFTRAREVANLLERHALWAVLGWRDTFDPENPSTEPPPKMARPDWFMLKHRVFSRDGRACVLCGSERLLEIDRIQPVSQGGVPSEDNLRVLCRTCNRTRKRGARS